MALAQTGLVPLIVPAAATVGVTVTARLALVPLKQLLVGVTLTLPEVDPQLTVIPAVPCPAVMLAPAGTVQSYPVAPGTALIE